MRNQLLLALPLLNVLLACGGVMPEDADAGGGAAGSTLGPPGNVAGGGAGGGGAAGGAAGSTTSPPGRAGAGGTFDGGHAPDPSPNFGGGGTGGSGGADGERTLPACGPGLAGGAPDVWVAFDSDRQDFNRDLYVVRPDGSQLTRLTEAPSIEREPAISPDGKRIAFTSDRDGSLQIYAMDVATRVVTKLTSRPEGADQPSFSSTGAWLAFHSGASVYVVPAEGGSAKLVATGLDTFNAFFSPHFLSGDTELTFDRNNEIDAVLLDGSGTRNIVGNTTTRIKSPSPSPQTSELVYETRCFTDRAESLWITPTTVSTPTCGGRRLTPPGDLKSVHPAWGPDNLFAYERVVEVTNVAHIALISRVPGSTPCGLAEGTGDDRHPTWSPTGFAP